MGESAVLWEGLSKMKLMNELGMMRWRAVDVSHNWISMNGI